MKMKPHCLETRTRREFLREAALATASLAVSGPVLSAAESAARPLNHNADMEHHGRAIDQERPLNQQPEEPRTPGCDGGEPRLCGIPVCQGRSPFL